MEELLYVCLLVECCNRNRGFLAVIVGKSFGFGIIVFLSAILPVDLACSNYQFIGILGLTIS